MDGSEVIIAVYGEPNVGKTTFITRSLGNRATRFDDNSWKSTVDVCGREVPVKIVENPELFTRALLVVILFDLTKHETYVSLPETLELAHRICPRGFIVIIGTKVDLRKEHHVTTAEAEEFCHNYQHGRIPYYEISKNPPEGIEALLKEILARPLINVQVLKTVTEKENSKFVHDTMEWAIENGSANILTYLRDLGYAIFEDLIYKYDNIIANYLIGEYPLQALSKFKVIKRPEFSNSYVDSELDEDDEPMSVIDTRGSLNISKTYLLQLSDISLIAVPQTLFTSSILPLNEITHVDFSNNLLTIVPSELFQLPSLSLLNLSHNSLSGLPPVYQWNHHSLEILNLSHNKLTSDVSSPVASQKKLSGSNAAVFQRLWYVDLSHCRLCSCPMWLMMCYFLKHLDLQGNKIYQLPMDLGMLTHLHTLLIKDLPLIDPPPPIPNLGTHTVLSYLQLKHKSTLPITSMRVVVIGPEKVGKTTLLSRLRGENGQIAPTKGLEVTEWNYRGDVLKRNLMTFDLWDFSGSPQYKFIYSCFGCQDSLHIAVFDIKTGYSEIIRWLSDVQSLSSQRIPMLIVFTHMDRCTSRDNKETEKRMRIEWLKYNLQVNEKPESSPVFTLLSSGISQTVKSLQDISQDRYLLNEKTVQEVISQQEYSSNLIPLMPFIIGDPFFVNNVNNEGISQLKKVLYRICTGSFRTTHPVLQNISIDVPAAYVQVESLMRQLRSNARSMKTEGEQKPFYQFSELKTRLRRTLKQMDISSCDFKAALYLLHQRGVIYVYDLPHETDKQTSPIVALNPQIIGYLLQRTIRSAEMQSESNILAGFLPNVHPTMIWGVDPVLSTDENTYSGISATQLVDFLTSVDLCAPIVPGACLVPLLLPTIPIPGTNLNFEFLETKRVYLLGYLPSFFWSHLMSRVLRTLAHNRLLQHSDPLAPVSPTTLPPRPENPLVTPTGAKLYLWKKHFVFEDTDGSRLWIIVFEGGQLGPESTQYCGRVDILVSAVKEKEALLLRIVTEEIDQLITQKYPSLLDNNHTPQLVDIFIPLNPSWLNSLKSPTHSCGGSIPIPTSLQQTQPLSSWGSSNGESLPRRYKDRTISSSSFVDVNSSYCSVNSLQGTLSEAIASIKATGALPRPSKLTSTESEVTGVEVEDESDFEDSGFYLVPAWECLQEAFKIPQYQLKEGSLDFQSLVPDLLFAEYPSTAFISVPDLHMSGIKIQESKGMFLRQYYNDQSLEAPKRHMGAQKMFSLKNHIVNLRRDYDLLSSLSCNYIVTSVGLHYSPPVLAIELSPHGSLRNYIDKGNPLRPVDVHQIANQVLNTMEFLNRRMLNYHYITCDNVFLWMLDPVAVKLSDAGLTHLSDKCILCNNLMSTLTSTNRESKKNRFNLIMFGLFLYEITIKRKAFENILPLDTVILGLYNQQIELNIQADLIHFRSSVNSKTSPETKACHELCLQTIFYMCTSQGDTTFDSIKHRLKLCAGDNTWAPLKLTLDVESLLTNSDDHSIVYWASGSRGLVIGHTNPNTGKLYSRILAQPPTPESGLFANRRGKPIPIAVGHATAIDLCKATNQIWVGTENGLMGSVYIFNLPELKSHHYIHLQDAVLSLKVVNNNSSNNPDSPYYALVGLANGTIILFLGRYQGRTLDNPLQGPKKVITTFNRKPCLSISIAEDGNVWCACGNNIEVFDISTMSSIRSLKCVLPDNGGDSPNTAAGKMDVIMYMMLSKQGVWTVTRRSSILRLWDLVTGEVKASFNVRNILKGEYNEITALVTQGRAVWVGTRSGYILLLDGRDLERKEQELALRGIQYCGEGRVKALAPFPGILKVFCSLEYPDEVSGCIMTWEYQSMLSWQPCSTPQRSLTSPSPDT